MFVFTSLLIFLGAFGHQTKLETLRPKLPKPNMLNVCISKSILKKIFSATGIIIELSHN